MGSVTQGCQRFLLQPLLSSFEILSLDSLRRNAPKRLAVPWSLGTQVVQDAATIGSERVPELFDKLLAAILATREGEKFNQIYSRWGSWPATLACFFGGCRFDVLIDFTLQELVLADVELDQIQDWPCHRDLFGAVTCLLGRESERIPDSELPQCVEAVEAMQHDRSTRQFRALRGRKRFECMVCLSWVGNSLRILCSAPRENHTVCRDCLLAASHGGTSWRSSFHRVASRARLAGCRSTRMEAVTT